MKNVDCFVTTFTVETTAVLLVLLRTWALRVEEKNGREIDGRWVLFPLLSKKLAKYQQYNSSRTMVKEIRIPTFI